MTVTDDVAPEEAGRWRQCRHVILDTPPGGAFDRIAALDLAAVVVGELELRLAARPSVEAAQQRRRDVERLGQAMQASLLPPELPSIPHVNMAARFSPASHHEVGGDFYDVFPIEHSCWGVVIGDVCGKGPEAAVRTGCARYSLRAAAIQRPAPSCVLSVANQALAEQDAPTAERFVTAVFARLEPTPEATVVTLSAGGHPLPIVLRADGHVFPVGRPGTLLGIFDEIDVSDSTVELAPGDTLVLFTDGVLDSGSPLPLQQEGLEELLRGFCGLAAGHVVEGIHDAVATAQRDDVAIVAVTAGP